MDESELKAEIDAMAACWKRLSQFGRESRTRMLRWLTARSDDSATPWEQPLETRRHAKEARKNARYDKEQAQNAR